MGQDNTMHETGTLQHFRIANPAVCARFVFAEDILLATGRIEEPAGT